MRDCSYVCGEFATCWRFSNLLADFLMDQYQRDLSELSKQSTAAPTSQHPKQRKENTPTSAFHHNICHLIIENCCFVANFLISCNFKSSFVQSTYLCVTKQILQEFQNDIKAKRVAPNSIELFAECEFLYNLALATVDHENITRYLPKLEEIGVQNKLLLSHHKFLVAKKYLQDGNLVEALLNSQKAFELINSIFLKLLKQSYLNSNNFNFSFNKPTSSSSSSSSPPTLSSSSPSPPPSSYFAYKVTKQKSIWRLF